MLQIIRILNFSFIYIDLDILRIIKDSLVSKININSIYDV